MGSNLHAYKSGALAHSLCRRGCLKPFDEMTRATPLFRFLDLPKEVRLMVYENLNTSKTIVKYNGLDMTSYDSLEQPSLVLTTHTLPVQLLATCRLIHSEASLVLAPKLAALKSYIPRILVSASSFNKASYNAIAHLIGIVLISLHSLLKVKRRDYSEPRVLKPSSVQHTEKTLDKWNLQTSALLAFQAQINTPPILNFSADPMLSYVRICVDVPRRWGSPSKHPRELRVSSSIKLAELLGGTLDSARKGGLDRVRSAMIVCAQEDKGQVECDRQVCALDYGVKRER